MMAVVVALLMHRSLPSGQWLDENGKAQKKDMVSIAGFCELSAALAICEHLADALRLIMRGRLYSSCVQSTVVCCMEMGPGL